jgi:Tripartite tricarboxylate transporter family receptor
MWAFSGLVHGADALRRWHQYRDRSGRACTRRRLHTASGQRGERDQRHALRKTGLQFHPRHRASCGVTSIPIVLVVNPSFRVKTVPELIAYAKANPRKITMASPFSVRPAVAPTKPRISSSATSSSSRCGGARKNAARFKREIEFDRRRPQIHSTNHRHNYG